MENDSRPKWIRGPALRARWGGMPTSTFYLRLEKRLIPAPCYPFGPDTPYWDVEAVEEFERKAPSEAMATGHGLRRRTPRTVGKIGGGSERA